VSEWPFRNLNSVASIFNGKTPSKADQRTEGHPVLKIKDVSAEGKFRGKFESFVDASFSSKYASKLLRAGDSLILNAAHNASHVAS
jgi:type I restriction enzyme S subunit